MLKTELSYLTAVKSYIDNKIHEKFKSILNLYWQISGKILRQFYWKKHQDQKLSYTVSVKKIEWMSFQ